MHKFSMNFILWTGILMYQALLGLWAAISPW